jgi:rod shape-determining protein MreC
MTDNRSRIAIALVSVALAGGALVSMLVDRRSSGHELSWWSGAVLDLAVPVQKMVATPIDFARDAVRDYVAVLDVRDENTQLRKQLASIEEENLQLREALVAGGRLARIAEMRDDFEVPMLPAELVGLDVSAWFRSGLVDRGRQHGVFSGMPVINEQGLVGLVTATSRTASKVMLLIDRQSAVDAVVQRSRSRGIVRGAHGDDLIFEFVVRDGDVQAGDVLVTSGLGGVYPKGLRIGEVTEVSASDSKMLRTAAVRPAVDFGRLEQVFVMLRRGPTMELLYATDEGDSADAPAPEPAARPKS